MGLPFITSNPHTIYTLPQFWVTFMKADALVQLDHLFRQQNSSKLSRVYQTARIAVAGGAGGLGKSIVEAIRKASKHHVVILSRHEQQDPTAVVIDYSSVQNLKSILERENVDTVISTIGAYTQVHHQSQLNLIEAAELAPSVKRFIPSEFGFKIGPEHVDRSPSFPFKIDTVHRLERSPLEFTLIHTGVYLFHLGLNLAAIPGDGNRILAFTHTKDVGEFVSLVLDLPKWERRYYGYADRLTLNDVVKVIEEVKGVKLDVTYDSRDALNRGECTLLPGPTESEFRDSKFDGQVLFRAYLAKLGSIVDDGLADLDAPVPIKETFPTYHPLTVRGAVEKWFAAD
ncbi:hypothetical protein BHE90_016741 [Fusarium euwallaceae]|uniref:NmrA-like domain-containing protein n=1 Tax=Fusarium euwallaceae TaxID=1147111 RepID=A0A430KZI9_9HYPO|nr:hypothetical protein BHE90_016741 [Fusarium euwallaceae]